MVDAVMNREKWEPLSKVSWPRSWGNPEKHYLPVSSGIINSGGNGNTFSDEPALAYGFISELNRRYEFRGGLVLEDFLRENPQIGRLLLEAHEVIRQYFGPGTRMALEVVADPEAPADQQLFIIVRTRFPPKVSRDLLSALDRGWWRTLPQTIKKKIEVDVE